MGAVRGCPRHLLLLLPPPHHTSAARDLGGPGAGATGTGKSHGGRPARARSLPLARTGRGGGRRGSGREARHPDPLPARPPDGRERGGHGGRSTTAARGPDDPRSGERAGAGRGAAGGDRRTAFRPHPRPTRNRRRRTGGDGGGPRSGSAEGPRSETPRDAARGSADATDAADGRTWERGPTRRGWLGPPSRRRDGHLTEGVAARREAGGHAPTRGGPGAIRRARTRVGRRGATRGLTARGLQRRGGPATHPGRRLASSSAPNTTTGSSPPRGARDHPPPPNLHEPRPARDNTLPHAHRPPRGPHHTHTPPPRPAPAPRLRNREHATRGRRRPRRPGGRHPHVGEASSVPETGGRGARRGGGGLGPAPTGRGRRHARTYTHTARAAGQGRGGRCPGREEGPRHDRATRKTSAGSHRHTHTRAVPRRLRRRPAPATRGPPTTRPRRRGPACATFPPRGTEGPVRPNSTSTSSPHPPSSKSDPPGARAPGKRSRARRPAP